MSKSTTPEPTSTTDIPDSLRERAEKAGRDAAERFLSAYRGEMRAHENGRAAREAGTAQPPRWLAEDPCPPWCDGGVDHVDATHPDDRHHYGPTHTVELLTVEPIVIGYPTHWAPDYLNLSLEQRYREREARVAIGKGDDTIAMATLAEAEQIAHHILAMVEQARAGWKPVPAPFDEHGRCEDRACRHCWTATGEIVEASL